MTWEIFWGCGVCIAIVRVCVCLFVHKFAVNILQTKRFRGSCPRWESKKCLLCIDEWRHRWRHVTPWSHTLDVTIFKVVAFGNYDLDQLPYCCFKRTLKNIVLKRERIRITTYCRRKIISRHRNSAFFSWWQLSVRKLSPGRLSVWTLQAYTITEHCIFKKSAHSA